METQFSGNISSPRIPAKILLDFLTPLSSINTIDELVAKYCPDFSTVNNNLPNLIDRNVLDIITEQLKTISTIYKQLDATSSARQASNQSNLLSISHLRGIYTALELLWSWGILPDLHLPHNSFKEPSPKSIILQSQLISTVNEKIKSDELKSCSQKKIPNIDWINIIFEICTLQMFRGMMLERFYKRILCACISILCHCTTQTLPTHDPVSLQNSRLYSQNLLNKVIIDPLVSPETFTSSNISQNEMIHVDIDRCTTIEALRYVSRCGTSTMQSIVASLLAMILIQPDGLRATLVVYLSGESEDRMISTRLTNLSKLITSPPANLPLSLLNSCHHYFISLFEVNHFPLPNDDLKENPSVDSSYFICLSYQLSKLFLELQKSKDSKIMLTACVLILGRLSLLCPQIVSYFSLQVWSQSILQIGHVIESKYLLSHTSSSSTSQQSPLANDTSLFDCIELFHIICTCVPLNSNLIECFHHNGIMEALLDLITFIFMSAPLSPLRQFMTSIWKELLLYGDSSKMVILFEQIIVLGWINSFRLIESGGIEIVKAGDNSILEEKKTLLSFIGSGLTSKSKSGTSSGIQISEVLGHSQEESLDDYLSILRDALLEQQSYHLNELSDHESQQNSSLQVVQSVMERTRSICDLFLEISPDEGENGETKSSSESNSLRLVPSKLFLRMLRGYLGISSQEDMEEVYISNTPSHVCGIVILVMKSHLSLDLLLQDGYQILVLLGTFLESHAKEMKSPMLHDNYLRKQPIQESSSSVERRGLIEEIVEVKSIIQSEEKSLFSTSYLENNENENENENEENSADETITTVLALLGSIMELGSFQREEKEEMLLRSHILPALQMIASQDNDTSLREMASDVALMIMVRGENERRRQEREQLNPQRTKNNSGVVTFLDELNEIEADLHDPDPPIRAYAIKRLISSLRSSSQKLSSSEVVTINDIFIQMLDDEESFVYLAAVHALSRLVDMNRKLLFPLLIELFAGRKPAAVATSTPKPISLKTRAALGEVLTISIRRAYELAPLFVPSIVAECIKICKNRVYLSNSHEKIQANLSKMQINIPSEEEISTKNENEMMELNQSIESLSTTAHLFYLRQSAYSLLSEALACGGWTTMKYISDTLDIAIGTLLHEQNYYTAPGTSPAPTSGLASELPSGGSDASLTAAHESSPSPLSSSLSPSHPSHPSHQQENTLIRRCSIFLLRYHLSSYKEKLFSIPNSGIYLKKIHAALTMCSRDKDEVISFQAQRGLELLDDLLKQQFIPKEESQMMPKIRILSEDYVS